MEGDRVGNDRRERSPSGAARKRPRSGPGGEGRGLTPQEARWLLEQMEKRRKHPTSEAELAAESTEHPAEIAEIQGIPPPEGPTEHAADMSTPTTARRGATRTRPAPPPQAAEAVRPPAIRKPAASSFWRFG